MGFFNKLRKNVQNKIVSPELAPFNRGRSVLTGLRNTNRRNIGSGIKFGPPQKATQVPRPIGEMPLTPENMERMVRDSFAGPRGNMGSDFRMPQKFTGLSGLFRRLQEQLRNQQMRMPQPIPELRAGEIMPNSPVLDRRPPPPRMPAPPIAVPPGIIPNLDLGMPVMPEERYSLKPKDMAPPVMNQIQGQPRMMMSRGRDANMVDFLNSDPQQQIFGIETRIGVLENKLQEALANNDRQSYDMIVDQINDADAQIIDIKNSINPLRTSGRPEMVGPKFDGFEEFITSIGPQNYGDYVGEPTLDDILSDLEKKN